VASRADAALPTRVVEIGGPGYPARALELAAPPARLRVRGRWPLADPAVAVVGARAATPYGLEVAARLGADLARLGITVVSGLAHGIDAAAHRGALAAGGATAAILPGGLDAIVPAAHVPLASDIARHGTLLSEHADGAGVFRRSFLERNRLIAALAAAVVVVEARVRSGALNTAHHARRLGRPLLAVPGDVDRESSRGCHRLLREGARVCEGAADVLAAIEATRQAGPPAAGASADAARGAAARLLAAIGRSARTAEECAARTGLTLAETEAALLELEWAGLVRAEPGARWRRREGTP